MLNNYSKLLVGSLVVFALGSCSGPSVVKESKRDPSLVVSSDRKSELNKDLSDKLVELASFVLSDPQSEKSNSQELKTANITIKLREKEYQVLVYDYDQAFSQNKDNIYVSTTVPEGEGNLEKFTSATDIGFDGNADRGEEFLLEKDTVLRRCGTRSRLTEEQEAEARIYYQKLLNSIEPDIDLLLEYYRSK